MSKLFELKNVQSLSISAENPNGLLGNGGKEASNLGVGRKGRPQITLPQGKATTIMDVQGPGMIRHIWFTVGHGMETIHVLAVIDRFRHFGFRDMFRER